MQKNIKQINLSNYSKIVNYIHTKILHQSPSCGFLIVLCTITYDFSFSFLYFNVNKDKWKFQEKRLLLLTFFNKSTVMVYFRFHLKIYGYLCFFTLKMLIFHLFKNFFKKFF